MLDGRDIKVVLGGRDIKLVLDGRDVRVDQVYAIHIILKMIRPCTFPKTAAQRH